MSLDEELGTLDLIWNAFLRPKRPEGEILDWSHWSIQISNMYEVQVNNGADLKKDFSDFTRYLAMCSLPKICYNDWKLRALLKDKYGHGHWSTDCYQSRASGALFDFLPDLVIVAVFGCAKISIGFLCVIILSCERTIQSTTPCIELFATQEFANVFVSPFLSSFVSIFVSAFVSVLASVFADYLQLQCTAQCTL